MLQTLIVFSIFTTITQINCIDSALEKYAIFPGLPPGVQSSDNRICADHSRMYRESLNNATLWAYQMWDSTAKSTVGILTGSLFHMGHFDECLAVEAPFPTQYCFVTLQASVPEIKRNDPLSLYHDPNESVLERIYFYGDKSQQPRNIAKIGWCTPASCKPGDLQIFLNDYVKNSSAPLIVQNHINFTVSLASVDCQSNEDQEIFDIVDVSFCILTIFLILTVTVATILDVNTVTEIDGKSINRSLPKKLLTAFSLKANFQSFIRIEDHDSALAVLHGMRTIAIIVVVFDHRFGTFVSSALLNFDYVESEYRKFYGCVIFRGDLFVDSFFTLGGILVTYGLLTQFDKKRINPALIVLLRYIRLTPVYAFVIFYIATIYNFTGSGPLWKAIVTTDRYDCRTNWWTNLLYINNYVNSNNICMLQSWYLPCDFHYFLIAIGICLLINKNRKIGLFTLTFFTLMSLIIPFVITMIYERPGLMHFYPEFLRSPKTYFDYQLTYIKSHTRAGPYFIGMITGYIYYRLKDTNKHISRVRSYIIVAISVIIIFASLTGGLVYYNPYHYYNKYESALYAAVNRSLFAVGSVGILYVASYGHGRLIYKILSWKPWIPLGKLVYSVYLIHMSFQLRAAAELESPRLFRYYNVIIWGVSDVVLSFFVALMLYLMIEAPFRRIFKELLMPPKQIEPNQGNCNETNNNQSSDSRL